MHRTPGSKHYNRRKSYAFGATGKIFGELFITKETFFCKNTLEKYFLFLQVGEIQDDITTLEQNDNFLFDEQVIQDERLLNLEVQNDETVDELDQINDSVQSEFYGSLDETGPQFMF